MSPMGRAMLIWASAKVATKVHREWKQWQINNALRKHCKQEKWMQGGLIESLEWVTPVRHCLWWLIRRHCNLPRWKIWAGGEIEWRWVQIDFHFYSLTDEVKGHREEWGVWTHTEGSQQGIYIFWCLSWELILYSCDSHLNHHFFRGMGAFNINIFYWVIFDLLLHGQNYDCSWLGITRS